MDIYTISSPQDSTTPPRSNTSTTTLYFDAMPSMSSIFNPHVRDRSNSPGQRGIKSVISAPIPITKLNGHTNMGDGEDDKTTLRAGGPSHADGGPASETPQDSSPVKVKTETAIGMSRHGNDSPVHDLSPHSSSHRRSLSRSEDPYGDATDGRSLRSVPVVYADTVPGGESWENNRSLPNISQKVTVKRTPSKLVKRRSSKNKRTEYLVNGHSVKGEGSVGRRSVSRNSQRSFRSSRGPVFEMVTAPPNATVNDAGGAFGAGAVMAAPENEVEEELRSEFQERLTTAERSLTRKQTVKIQREERALRCSFFVQFFVSYEFFLLSHSGGVEENL